MPENTQKTDISIIGGGFAGLSAALRLHRAGAKIQLFEKRPFFGGRAYSFAEPKTGEVVDNGQHLLMGAYHETFAFLKDLGTLDKLHFQKGLEVSFAQGAEQFSTIKCPNLPAPFHLAWGLLRFKALKFGDKRRMAKLIQFCKKPQQNGQALDDLSLLQLFRKTGQSQKAIQVFWEPLALATLNEPLDLASAELFVEVLKQGLLSNKADSNLVIPKVGFSELYAQPAQNLFQKDGVPMHFNSQIAAIEKSGSTWEIKTNQGKSFSTEKILFAIPPNGLQKILEVSDPSLKPLGEHLEKFKSSPIVSVNLWFDNFNPEQTFLGLIDSPIHWVFNKAKIYAPAPFGAGQSPLPSHEGRRPAPNGAGVGYLSLVISGAYELAQKSKLQLIQLATEELRRFYPALRDQEPTHAQVIKENEATFSGRLGLKNYRPDPATAVPGIYLAGDWANTGLPATIESAVRSGHQAANILLGKHHGE